MKLKKKINKPLVFIMMILISLSTSATILGYIYYLFPKLSDFQITNIKEEKENLYLYTTKCYNAVSYIATAYDEDENVLYETQSNTNKINITDMILDYNEKVTFKVSTKNRKNENKWASNSYDYTNNSASFAKIKDHFIDKDEDIVLYLIGYNEDENYHVNLYYKNSKVLSEDLSDNFINIKYDDIKSYEGRITAKLYNKNNRVISVFNFYLNAPIVGNLKITSPQNNYTSSWDDIDLYYTGGTNATELTIKIYNKKNKIVDLIKMPFQEEKVTLKANLFKENETYKIELMASYQDYTEISKSDSIYVNILDKLTVSPVYVDKNFTFIKSGSEVSLLTNTTNAKIYYTIDGTTPTEDSLEYTEPIVINNDTTIKTYAVKNNMNDSEINIYEFKVKTKNLVVYLSPSNQYSNKGISSVGYTNERDMMNKLTDYLEADLKAAGVEVYRNKSSGNINAWLAESNRKNSDLHLAIHSNGSENHDTKGMEIYVDKETSKCLSIASNIYNNLYEIYPYRDEISDRGVKYADGSLGEVNDNFIKCGTLIEIAYHDNYYDALWMVENMETIADNIANSILEFYQIKE
jgi:N-acetylmuramoyl-L-alanine amidase